MASLIRMHARCRNAMICAPSSPELSMASTRRSPVMSSMVRAVVRTYCQSVAMYWRMSAARAGRKRAMLLIAMPTRVDSTSATSVATTRTTCSMATTRFTALAGHPRW